MSYNNSMNIPTAFLSICVHSVVLASDHCNTGFLPVKTDAFRDLHSGLPAECLEREERLCQLCVFVIYLWFLGLNKIQVASLESLLCVCNV